MSNFGLYSKYYDLLYAEKDYAAEAEHVRDLIVAHRPTAQSVLELGCGTGMHACLLAKAGFSVHGVDSSSEMLVRAQHRLSTIDQDLARRLSFEGGDLRTYRAGRSFDAVIALFHVMSYQTRDEDLEQALRTAAEHLEAGGVFVFDFWYGPAVLWQRPTQRIKRLEDESISVLRFAEPAVHPNDNVVDVHYTIVAHDKQCGTTQTVAELHRMRYLFMPELDSLLARSGFVRKRATAWLSSMAPSLDTWGVCVVAEKGHAN